MVRGGKIRRPRLLSPEKIEELACWTSPLKARTWPPRLERRTELAPAGREDSCRGPRSPRNWCLTRSSRRPAAAGTVLFVLTFLSLALIEYRTRRVYSPDRCDARAVYPSCLGTLPTMPTAARNPLPGPAGTYLPEQEAVP